ncbi:hypothetical protein GOBAR_DD30819 [Gossypium barbadense]|nr:hypothetical protein GOBAR_DD30819 [Gossypium barbadense]
MGYIGSHGVQALKRYKYSGVDHSYLAKYVLQPFWSRFVNFFPLWMPIQNVHKVIQARKGSMLLALAMLYPFVVLMGGVLIWDYLSPSDIMGNYPHLVILGTGLAFGFLVGRMILAHLCDEPKGLKTNMCMMAKDRIENPLMNPPVSESLLYLPLAIANALTARLNDGHELRSNLFELELSYQEAFPSGMSRNKQG